MRAASIQIVIFSYVIITIKCVLKQIERNRGNVITNIIVNF